MRSVWKGNNMSIYTKLLNKEAKLSLVGLGYVGMPIAVAFAKKLDVIGFDVNEQKIEQYKNGIDPTCEIGNQGIKECRVDFTSDESRLKEAEILSTPQALGRRAP